MTELGKRSGSQILRTFLPQQTADLNGRIVRVTEWDSPRLLPVDTEMVRRRLIRDLMPWVATGSDQGLARELETAEIELLALDYRRGVTVERWPTVWLCRNCRRVGRTMSKDCRCGQRRWGQLHFVGFHTCGAVYEPWIKRCPAHDDVMMVSPKSTSAKDIRFECPECHIEVMSGLGFKRCDCGQGQVIWNVHKARSVYAPRSIVLVNPPRPEKLRALAAAGGPMRALGWMLDGMPERTPATTQAGVSRTTFVDDLVQNKGFARELAEQMADVAAKGGGFVDESADNDIRRLSETQRSEAEHEAVDVGMAASEARLTIADLAAALPGASLSDLYEKTYPKALERAGLEAVDLIEKFPVLNGAYGYVRGGGEPGEHRLVPYRSPRGGYRVYGDQVETEALFFRLDPERVATWMRDRGHKSVGSWDSRRSARLAILAASDQAQPNADGALPMDDLRKLVHSYAHRVIRQTAAAAGIDRDSLSEYLVPLHAGFFLYSSNSFVLGGLQAVFETELDRLLTGVVDGERRCPLDPGCSRGSAACIGCLHIGEPSCRHFNSELDRRTLFGVGGYLA